MPTNILFSNNGSDTLKTPDFTFQNGGYYDVYGLLGNANTPTGMGLTPTLSQGEGTWYSLDGRRVTTPTKGVYIHNGRKVIVR
jgi:hypothetical protein